MDFKQMNLMKIFVRKYFNIYKGQKINILDVGSKNEMGRHKTLIFRRYFRDVNWNFIGLDIVPGDNVDVVTIDQYHYDFPDKHFEIVICASVLEHVEDIYTLVKEMARVTNRYLILIAPWDRPIHNYPIDCWRISPTGLKFMVEKLINFKIIEFGFVGRDSYILSERK